MDRFYDEFKESILEGDVENAISLTREQIEKGENPINIVQDYLVPVLDDVGDLFSRLEIFLPDLILSADAAKAVKDEIRLHLLTEMGEADSKGKVVIGTIQGDVHDIGKNIVATLLEVNGYKVIDMGNDVSPYNFIEAARRETADIIALSSLLTTSMPYMADTLKLLNGLGIRDKFKVIVGGGPVSPEWAAKIGADGYSNDANEAVELCGKIMIQLKGGK